MKFVVNILRLFGYNIVRYYKPQSTIDKVLSLNTDNKDNKTVIRKDVAEKALISVGRKSNTPAFTLYQRPSKSSAELNDLETIWWNEHGNTIEKVWVFSEAVNNKYRQSYVSKADLFFKKSNVKNKVLDLGCGSGWFGRMIADEDLACYGIDFSSTQIEIANKIKEKALNKYYLKYYCTDDFKKIENIGAISGVNIHAFLHHLYWDELHSLFNELVENLPNGCKFFITEPIYPNQNEINYISNEQKNSNNEFVRAFRLKLDLIKNELIDKGLYDSKTEFELIKIINESEQNGFFLSPKEVPFILNEFQTFLSKYLTIERHYHCGILNLETAQLIEKIKTKDVQNYYSDLLFPIANALDEILLNNYYFETNTNNYLFTVFECVLQKDKTHK